MPSKLQEQTPINQNDIIAPPPLKVLHCDYAEPIVEARPLVKMGLNPDAGKITFAGVAEAFPELPTA
ncbi:MAG: hypothetical protein Q3974_00875 [Rothia sp. (in: high G+C Gram-positive bacteria)]|nr:hypothetical protein [Rothia sp. (in: high G+C Gram-positive bacteria)]